MKNSKACRRTKYGKLNSIASGNKIQMLKVKIGLFLFKLEIHCMTVQKLNLHEVVKILTIFGKPKNCLTGI